MEADRSKKAVLVGDESLLCACGDLIIDRGWSIDAVKTNGPRVREWAKSKGLRLVDKWSEISRIDTLFSVTNFAIIPKHVLERIEGRGFNFHDGPLPERGGLNVTNWSILHGDESHAVSWHYLSAAADAGAVCSREEFAIEADETAFSLNAKCFEFGLDSFKLLIEKLEAKQLPEALDTPPVEYYGRDDKPAGYGFLHWGRSASENWALYRSLDNQRYRNGLISPRVLIDDAVYIVESCEVEVEQAQKAAPGSVMDVGATGLLITCAQDAIRIQRLCDQNGKQVDLGSLNLSSGDRLSVATVDRLYASEQPLLDHGWLRQLRDFRPVPLPLTNVSHPAESRKTRLLTGPLDEATTLAAIALTLGRLNDAVNVQFAASTGTLKHTQRWLASEKWPLSLDIDCDADALVNKAKAYTGTDLPATLSADLGYRYPEVTGAWQALHGANWQYTTCVAEEDIAGIVNVAHTLSYVADTGELWLTSACPEEESLAFAEKLSLSLSALDDARDLRRWDLLSPEDVRRLQNVHGDACPVDQRPLIEVLDEAAAQCGSRNAVVGPDGALTFDELKVRSEAIAVSLLSRGIQPLDRVAVLLSRGCDMVAALIAIMRVGAVYVPLDPSYPDARLRFILDDADVGLLLVDRRTATLQSPDIEHATLRVDEVQATSAAAATPRIDGANPLYMIYTSGSTGQPKGVIVSNANVMNFLTAMDKALGSPPAVMLSVTSISFDISVLELWWSLSRGATVLVYDASLEQFATHGDTAALPELGLYFWNTEQQSNEVGETYKLLLEGAKFADRAGFKAVWTPERHFGDFGAPYANASVTSAAVAAVTNNIEIRAGSCVLPLHHPVRVAEEWAMVDQMSGGRVGVSFASGWMPNDFALRPENFRDAKEVMWREIESVRALWRGEARQYEGPNGPVEVTTKPRPVQRELPTWVTTAGSRDTFARAGSGGYNVLTHMLGQDADTLRANVDAYREAWKDAGHPGTGHVTLMLHTLVADSSVSAKTLAREPMKRFLRSSLSLVKDAAWEFPTFKRMTEEGKGDLDEYFANIDDDDLEDLLEFAFERYFASAGLFGSVEECHARLSHYAGIGADEIGCLVDFGLPTDTVLTHLSYLAELHERAQAQNVVGFADLAKTHAATHLQCTPSQMHMLMMDAANKAAIAALDTVLIGGEALAQSVADNACELVNGRVFNMYGPTETTVWSSVKALEPGAPVTIGKPIANTLIALLDSGNRRVGVGQPGRLFIGGHGVCLGYHNRDDLNDEKFIELDEQRYYDTGDWARLNEAGELEYLGRQDDQVKVRGYRIELGEIENAIAEHPLVERAVVTTREAADGQAQLVACYQGRDDIAHSELRAFLTARIPSYMVPDLSIRLEALPETPNGKVDRKKLPTSKPRAPKAPLANSAVQGESTTQKKVREIWQALLEQDRIDADANFFDIGGHSILAVRMQGQLTEAFDRKFRISEVFRFPTIHTMTANIEQANTKSESPRQSRRMQRRLRRRVGSSSNTTKDNVDG